MKMTTLFLFIYFTCFFSTRGENKIQEDLKKDKAEIGVISNRAKLAACMSLIQSRLQEGNPELKDAIDSSNFDRSKTYDKLIASLVKTCKENIKGSQVDILLNSNHVMSSLPEGNRDELLGLITVNKNIVQGESIRLTNEEQEILNEINDAVSAMDSDVTLQDEEVGFAGIKLSQMGCWNYIFVGIAIILVITIVIGGLYSVLRDKKSHKKKK